MVQAKNSQSQTAMLINDQYFTPVETAQWCFNVVSESTNWDFKGTALEPSVGAFAFPNAASNLGLNLDWTTNDLYPQPDLHPTFQEDFKVFDKGRFDYVITNPPFGKVNTLARTFAKRSCTMSDRVMMLLPRGARRMGFLDSMPRDMAVVHEELIPDETFVLSTGEVKQVPACVIAWERVDYEIPTIKSQLELRDDLIIHWTSNKEDWDSKLGEIDFQIARWGDMGKIFTPEKMKQSGARISVKCNDISREDFEEVHKAIDLSDFIGKSNCPPAFDVPMWLHRFNTEAVKKGLLPPV